jgi:hypothetical protein
MSHRGPGARRFSLPERDDTIGALDEALRLKIAATWERRSTEELKVAATFAALVDELLRSGADRQVLTLVARGVSEEVRHGEICHELASRYRGEPAPWPPPIHASTAPPPGPRESRGMLHVFGSLCVNESIAATYLEQSLRDARAPSVRAVLQELFADEVTHARSGWLFAASAVKTDASRRAIIEEHAASLVKTVVGCWWGEDMLLLPEGVPEHGLPSVSATREAALIAIRDLVVPGLAELGIDAEPTRAWVSGVSPEMESLPA